jgi:hypothetical protein
VRGERQEVEVAVEGVELGERFHGLQRRKPRGQ